jgi:hypothetical protein
MVDYKIAAIAVALLGTVAIVPVAAQPPPPPPGNATSSETLNATVPDETVPRTGAAFKVVTEIKNVYAPKVEAAPTPDERAQLGNQEIECHQEGNRRAGIDHRSVRQRDETCAG